MFPANVYKNPFCVINTQQAAGPLWMTAYKVLSGVVALKSRTTLVVKIPNEKSVKCNSETTNLQMKQA